MYKGFSNLSCKQWWSFIKGQAANKLYFSKRLVTLAVDFHMLNATEHSDVLQRGLGHAGSHLSQLPPEVAWDHPASHCLFPEHWSANVPSTPFYPFNGYYHLKDWCEGAHQRGLGRLIKIQDSVVICHPLRGVKIVRNGLTENLP